MESSMQVSSSHESPMAVDQRNLIMDEELWKDFPRDLHVKILGSFSILELCQFRTISPAWNDLAEHLISRAWNDIMEELKARPQAMYVFRTPQILHLGVGSSENLVRPSWEVYDPSTRQCFPLNMQFLKTKDEFGRLCGVEEECITIAADKGFICVLFGFYSEKIKVINPMTGCVVELPPLLGFPSRSVLVVAEDYTSFSLYVIMDYVLKRFDSNLGVWREIPQSPATFYVFQILHLKFSLFIISWVYDYHNIVDQARLFVLDTTTTQSEWCDTGVELPLEVASLHLTTTLGCLFIAFFLKNRIELWEVDAATFSCTVVISMDKSNKFYKELHKYRSKIVVVGCGNFIVFSSVSGASVAYDLVNSKWCEWIHSNKIPKRDYLYATCRSSLYATSMSLTLNPVPSVHRSI